MNGGPGGSAQAGTISADGLYTAPIDLPTGGTVQVTATSQADASKSASATVTVASDIAVSVTPSVSSVELGAQQTFQATIQSRGKPDSSVRWSLVGAACPNACGNVSGNGAYTAPQILPNATTVTLVATSVADPSKQGSASVIITSHFMLQLSAPKNMAMGTSSSLVATLTPVPGSNPNPTLSWSMSGSGCVASACGLLSVTTTQSAGGTPLENTAVFTAPTTAPQPDTVLITVTPLADPSKQVQANITILAGASLSISPASATVVANGRITLNATENGTNGALNWTVNGVTGGNTTYAGICTAPVTSTDVAQAGNLNIQVQNPNASTSNVVQLVVVQPSTVNDVITLTASSPSATGMNIIVVEPTTAGIDAEDDDLDLNIAAIGMYTTSTNTCSLGGNAIPLVRPSSGTATADICVFSESGLDTSMAYTVSGPGDVAAISQQPAGLGIIHLTLQVPAAATPGARTLFIQNTNLDQTSASGVLQVQ